MQLTPAPPADSMRPLRYHGWRLRLAYRRQAAPLRCLAAGLLLVLPHSGKALSANGLISQYSHTAWRLQDGVWASPPNSMTQTADGYIWIGSAAGVVRFDGVRFVSWEKVTSRPVPTAGAVKVTATSDGGIWISSVNSLGRWHNGTLTSTPGYYPATTPAHAGAIWALKVDYPSLTANPCLVTSDSMRCLTESEGITKRLYLAISQGRNDDLWLGGADGVVHWKDNSSHEYQLPAIKGHPFIYILGLAVAPDGSVWVTCGARGKGLGVQHLVNGSFRPFTAPGFDSSNVMATAVFVDSEGMLWIGAADGLYRISGDRVEHFRAADGLSGENVLEIHEDREGSLWVVTSGGIDMFRDTPVHSMSKGRGLLVAEPDMVMAASDGSIWVTGESLNVLPAHGNVAVVHSAVPEVEGAQYRALLEDRSGAIWLGTDKNVFRYAHGSFEVVRRKDGQSTGAVRDLAENADGDIWAAGVTPEAMLLRIHGLQVEQVVSSAVVPRARSIAVGPDGSVWLGLYDGTLGRYHAGRFDTFSFAGASKQPVYQVSAAADGTVLGATDDGLIGVRDGRRLRLTMTNGLPCHSVFSFIPDAQSNLWLYTSCGLLRISASDLRIWLSDTTARVSARVFDGLDGAHPASAPFRSAARSPDGRLWFVNQRDLQVIDPAHLDVNPLPPPVQIERVIADRHSYPDPINAELHLPALTRDLEIDFTALSFVAPSKIMFRYQLEGRDRNWVDAGARRQAFYTDLPPGDYRFKVIAANSDGVWNNTGMSLKFSVAPAWYQTYLVWGTCVVLIALLSWTIYAWRLRRISKAIAARYDERLSERTRLARELHDTLLQTIQSSKLIAEDALLNARDMKDMSETVRRLSVWLTRAVEEGRKALNSLRASSEAGNLPLALQRAMQESRLQKPIGTFLSVSGTPRDMDPAILEEVYRIGYEAIRNACKHSKGKRLDVKLEFAQDLRLQVQDDGIGIDPRVADEGKIDHFGMQGMRERASRIDAQLSIFSPPGGGTEVSLLVSGRIAYLSQPKFRFRRQRASSSGTPVND